MKLLALASVLAGLLLAASACGSSHPAASNGLHSAAYRSLPHSLRLLIRRSLAKPIDGPTHEIDVYGPGTLAELGLGETADSVNEPHRKKDFYLIVWRGRFVCHWCSSPGPTGDNDPPEPPHGAFETIVWSASRGVTDAAIGGRPLAEISRLQPVAVITQS